MQLSETVVAAMIGAIATVSTALFQLFTMLRSRSKLDVRPKKGRTLKSILAVVALMLASGAGGYLYSQMRQQSAGEDLHSMREELNAKLQLLASTTERIAQMRENAGLAQTQVAAQSPPVAVGVSNAAAINSTESVIYAPGCQTGACTEANAQRLMLCGAIPTVMQVRKVELFAKTADSKTEWDHAAANFDQDIGGAKFSGAPSEHAQDENRKAVCVNFVHWSSEPHIARLVLQYGVADRAAPSADSAAVAATALISPTQSVSLIAPAN